MECPENAHMAQGIKKKKKKEYNHDQMMWELELNKRCFGASLEAFALQIPVLGKFCMCNHGNGHLE